jgi:hypothetical protein
VDRPYGRYGEKHYDKLFLIEHWMLNEGIGEADEASAALFEKGG